MFSTMTPFHPAFDGPLRLQFIGLADAAAALSLDPVGLSALCGDAPEASAAAVVHRVYVGTTD
ncbi:hypothetical protein, partial [Ideonella sp.]|uniref:hypothetical protein n=1 Tax=Ideonella sp. TaxID=1929293 RepID=UPI003BB60EF5